MKESLKVGVVPTFLIITSVLTTGTYVLAEAQTEKQREEIIAKGRIEEAINNLTGIMEADKAGNYNIEYGDTYSTVKNAENITSAFDMKVTVETNEELNTFELGEHPIVYTLTSDGITEEKTIMYNIMDSQKPVVKFKIGDSITITEGDKFSKDKIGIECSDPVDGKLNEVKALDKDSNDWNGGYTVQTDWKDGNPAGEYFYLVEAEDVNGNVEKKKFTVIVNPKPEKSETESSTAQYLVQNNSASYLQTSQASNGVTPSQTIAEPAVPRACQMNEICIGNSYHAVLYQSSSESNSVNQPIVDAKNSAVLMNYLGRSMIADHASQGFGAICYESNGYIYGTPITCIARLHGTNTGDGIMLDDGQYADEVYNGSYILYTCNDSSGVDVTVTFWTVS